MLVKLADETDGELEVIRESDSNNSDPPAITPPTAWVSQGNFRLLVLFSSTATLNFEISENNNANPMFFCKFLDYELIYLIGIQTNKYEYNSLRNILF